VAEILSFPGSGDLPRRTHRRPTPMSGFNRDPNPSSIPPDQHDRAAALDITQSWIVEAPAGSGKTGLLIQRFLKLLGSPYVKHPAEVLAITFTRKATGELRDRVAGQLASASRDAAEPENSFDRDTRQLALAVLARDAELGWHLVDEPHRLNIRTIDSLAAEIARSLPVLAGSGMLAPVDDASRLHREAARRTLLLLGGDDDVLTDSLRTVLLHRDGNLADCETLLADMLAWREQWGDLIPLGAHELDDTFLDETLQPRLNGALELAICRGLTHLTRLMPAQTLERLSHFAASMAHAEGYNGAPSPLAFCAGRHQPPAEEAAHLQHWRVLIELLLTGGGTFRSPRGLNINHVRFVLNKGQKEELSAILDEIRDNELLRMALCSARCLPPLQYPAEQWPIVKALFRVLSRALVELQFVFTRHGECDFTESALQARAALRPEGAILDLGASLGTSLRHLLVDEMQDTSTGQYQLVELLTRGWGGEGETLFLVGDPKQSIYAFRQARVERFVTTMARQSLGPLPLGNVSLSANFRSQQLLVKDFNDTFSQLFPQPDPSQPELVPFRQAHAVRPATAAAAQVWHPVVLPYQPDKALCREEKRAAQQAQAAEIKRLAEQWIARPLPPDRLRDGKPWTIAVLVRNRTHLLDIVKSFQAEPTVPFRALDIEPLGERQEVLDLVSLTRALLHPADRTAWLALLRSPWCGLTLVDLHILTGSDDRQFRYAPVAKLIASRGELLSADGIERLESFWIVMEAALVQRTQMPLARIVELTWRSFAGPTYTTGEELANSIQFFRLLERLESPIGSIDLDQLAAGLDRLYAAPATYPPGMAVVDCTTIHKSKGLEWDVVFVPSLDGRAQQDKSRLLGWMEIDGGSALDDTSAENAPAHGIIAPIGSRGQETPELNKWMRQVQTARETAERTRLFYVVCTRAREELHLLGIATESAKGKLLSGTGSLLATAWPVAGPIFEAVRKAAPGVTPLLDSILERPDDAQAAPVFALAAAAEPPPSAARTLERIPKAAINPARYFVPALAEASFTRPAGSFSARAFGNTVHNFIEQLARRIASGATLAELHAELPSWATRAGSVLRSAGLAPALVERYTADTMRALNRTIDSAAGRWILSPHPGASSERAFTLAGENDRLSGVRLDRTFLAGPEPGSAGDTHLWIIDYKTGTHGQLDLGSFLAAERAKYRDQLESYAQTLAPGQPSRPIHLALFYPLLGELVWWPFTPGTKNA
jgi:ATP-dependent helicase/nuclease subunit A